MHKSSTLNQPPPTPKIGKGNVCQGIRKLSIGDYWPKMEEQISGYVRACHLASQQLHEADYNRPGGYNSCIPLPISGSKCRMDSFSESDLATPVLLLSL